MTAYLNPILRQLHSPDAIEHYILGVCAAKCVQCSERSIHQVNQVRESEICRQFSLQLWLEQKDEESTTLALFS